MTDKIKISERRSVIASEIVIEPDSEEYRRAKKMRLEVVAKNLKENEELLARMRPLGVTLNSLEDARNLSSRDFRSFAAAAKEEMSKLAMPGVRAVLAWALNDAKGRGLGAGSLLQEFVRSHDGCAKSEDALYIGAAIVRMARKHTVTPCSRKCGLSRAMRIGISSH